MMLCSLKRSICLLLAFSILFLMLPLPGSAAEETADPTENSTSETGESVAPSTEETVQESTSSPSVPTEASAPASEPVTEASTAVSEPPESESTASDPSESTGATESTTPMTVSADSGEEKPAVSGPGLYFGQLHAHTELSGSSGTAQALFLAARQAGLDFFAVTDHSNAFDNAALGALSLDGSTVSQHWSAGKAAAQAATDSGFVGIFGFEMSWPEQMQLGHISTFRTPGFQSWEQDSYRVSGSALQNYYSTLASQPGSVSQFSHPGEQYGNFSEFDHYSEAADRCITLLEIAGPANDSSGYDQYIAALDKGWHIAPTNNRGTGRTVVYAQSLTEASLYDAMSNCQVYATEDSDLEILYTMDGAFMGSRVKLRNVGSTADISVTLYDPTDSAAGTVEVITEGGRSVTSRTLTLNHGTAVFSLSPETAYYFLRITQPDGDVAVTAPVWIDGTESLGISDLSCRTQIPVQGEAVCLELSLYNEETTDFLVSKAEIYADGICIATDTSLSRIPARGTASHDLTFTYSGVGQTEITAVLSGTLAGADRSCSKSLTLSFRQSGQVTGICIDGGHQNRGLQKLDTLKALATAEDIRVTVSDREMSPDILENCRFLLVTPPEVPFSQAFLDAVADYTAYGGSVILCGQSVTGDGDTASAQELNRLLAAVGSSMALNADTAADSVSNGDREDLLFADTFNSASSWCAGITEDQVYRQSAGCTVNPGAGDWLVKTADGQVLLARESLPAGGSIFAAGDIFCSDSHISEPENIWDSPYANRNLVQNLLGIGGETLPLSSIRQARNTEANTVLRIRGYVTAGTANPGNTFPDTLYLQDSTGGIAVMPFRETGISVGTPMEITGTVETRAGNLILKPVSHKILTAAAYRCLPLTGSWKTVLDPSLHGGELVQVEGTCTEALVSSGKLTRFTVKDSNGNLATVLIEEGILAGSTGKNELHKEVKKGRKIRAIGLLHTNEDGSAVIRVRNCEEVVYVRPRSYYYLNPQTGDPFLFPVRGLLLSAGVLFRLRKHK